MIIIHHRRNLLSELDQSPVEFGIEIDLRNHGQDIIVTHDPFLTDAITIEEWLKHYKHQFLIANVKEEGMEPKLLELFKQYKINDFFILDESIPYIRKYALTGLSNFAVRISELESIETALLMAAYLKNNNQKIDWIWADSFTGAVLSPEHATALRMAGYRICLVSPELHHVNDPASWEQRASDYIQILKRPEMQASIPDMVCTKCVDLWQKSFNQI